MAKTTAQPTTLRGSKARLRTSRELLEELNPLMSDLVAAVAAVEVAVRASAQHDPDADLALTYIAGALKRDAGQVDRLFTQALEATWGYTPLPEETDA
jgi:hypothetical protein